MPTLYRTFGSSASMPTLYRNSNGSLRLCCCEPPLGDPCTNCSDAGLPDTTTVDATSGFSGPGANCGCLDGLSATLTRANSCTWSYRGPLGEVVCAGQSLYVDMSIAKISGFLVAVVSLLRADTSVFIQSTYRLARSNALSCRGTFVLNEFVSGSCSGASVTITI